MSENKTTPHQSTELMVDATWVLGPRNAQRAPKNDASRPVGFRDMGSWSDYVHVSQDLNNIVFELQAGPSYVSDGKGSFTENTNGVQIDAVVKCTAMIVEHARLYCRDEAKDVVAAQMYAKVADALTHALSMLFYRHAVMRDEHQVGNPFPWSEIDRNDAIYADAIEHAEGILSQCESFRYDPDDPRAIAFSPKTADVLPGAAISGDRKTVSFDLRPEIEGNHLVSLRGLLTAIEFTLLHVHLLNAVPVFRNQYLPVMRHLCNAGNGLRKHLSTQ